MVNHVTLPDGSVADGTDVICDGCNSSLADHSCAGSGAAGSTGSVTYSRSTGPRKAPSAHPTCPHCGGRVHFNMAGVLVNDECITRQYALDQGLITDPNTRLPNHLGTPEAMGEISAWAKTLSTPISYGKMESAAGGAATYSGMRVKTGRKKKVVAAAPGAQIQDMAADEDISLVDDEAPAKPKKSRKLKVSKLTVDENGTASTESVDLDEAVSSGVVPLPEILMRQMDEDEGSAVAPEATSEQDEAAPDNGDAARQSRAERRAARKALLAGKA